jgi:hypothetical protein|tara:strand:- start:533 stop:1597 length:1065 start_codon:yes stop_codon:yes gene_type:complete
MPIKEIRTQKLDTFYLRLTDPNHRDHISITSPDCDFQRGGEDGVWSKKQKQQFILSLYLCFPFGTITLLDHKGEWLVLDGGNRCRAIKSFMNDEFEVELTKNELKKYSELDEKIQDKIKNIQIPCEEIKLMKEDDDNIIAKMFIAMNISFTKLSDGELLKALDWNDSNILINYVKSFIQNKWKITDKNNKLDTLKISWEEIFGVIKEDKRYKDLEFFTSLFLSSFQRNFEYLDQHYKDYGNILEENKKYDINIIIDDLTKFTDFIKELKQHNSSIHKFLGTTKGIPSKSKIAVIWYLVIENKIQDNCYIDYFKCIQTNEKEYKIYCDMFTMSGDNHVTNSKIKTIVDYIEKWKN